MDDPKALVCSGYNQISHRYRTDDFDFDRSAYKERAVELEQYLKPSDRVLDLGCGCGIPIARYLSQRYSVTGLDISEVQVGRARALVPTARFVQGDMTEAVFTDGSFEAVVSFYAMIHVPVEEQPGLLKRIACWLVDDGTLMATLGHTAWTGTEANWYGADMYWSHADAATYRAWLARAGFVITAENFMPEGNSGHTFFTAHKRAGFNP